MTSEEEAVLREYLLHYKEIEKDEDFEPWYLQRFEDAKAEVYYKHTLEMAQVWKSRFQEGFRTGVKASLVVGLARSTN